MTDILYKWHKLDHIVINTTRVTKTLLELCTIHAPPGLKLEFGVATGSTINRIAAHTTDLVYGFDSFEGLPEPWLTMDKGHFSTGGVLPEVRENVRLIKGWFSDTLPRFLEETPGEIGFCHVDCDLYSSTTFILNSIGNRFAEKSVIIFDELAGFNGYEDHEFKAFLEFLVNFKYDFDFLGRVDAESYAFRLRKE